MSIAIHLNKFGRLMTTGRNNGSVCTFTQTARNVNLAPSIRKCLKQVRTGMYVVLCLFTLASFASAQASRNKKRSTKPASPTNGSPTTFTLDVDQMYCDESLPYAYKSTPGKLELTVGQLQNTSDPRAAANWGDVLKNDWERFAKAASHEPDKDPAIVTPNFIDPAFPSTSTGAWDEPPTDDGSLDDSGRPILFDPTWDLSSSTYDAQRLLVRTLFGPNPFQVACAYPYLKYPNAGKNDPVHTGVDNNPIRLLTKGAGYPFSLNAKDAPKYYLINIVRWKDATSPKGAPSNQNQPFFQAASDDWYLLNYSDSQDRHQDISQWFHKITPSMVSDTLRIIGSDKVMFLGIHLAPLPVLGDKGIPNPNPDSAPATEQAWFDAVSLKYTFQASAATPTNMADLNTLLSIVLGGVGLSAPQQQNNPAAAPPPPARLSDALDDLKASLASIDPIDLFLHQPDLQSYFKSRHYGVEPLSTGESGLLRITNGEGDKSPIRLTVDPTVEAQIRTLADSDPTNSTAMGAIQGDIEAISRLRAAIASPKTVLSTYQGRYVAGLLTNLQNLPVTLASNWTANFSTVTVSPIWAGNAGVYDLTKPATEADKSNRAGITSSKAEAKKTNGKSAGTQATPAPASGKSGMEFVDAPTVARAASSTHHNFGPSLAATDPGRLPGSLDDPAQDSTQHSKSDPAKDSGTQPTGGKKNSGKNSGKSSGATSTNSGASNSPKNATATASTICTISLTPGSTTANPQTQQTQTACSDQQNKILDEGRSRWDVSVIVPITGYKDLTFQSASSGTSGPNIITAKSITRENAYGVFDLYLVPEDLINPPYLGIPHIVVGLPFAGQVFNKPYFAIGESINFPKMIAKIPIVSKLPLLSNFAQKDLPLFVRPVFGWVDNKVYPTVGAPAYRSLKPQFSIEMSFSSIKNAVQTLSKNSSNGSGNTTKPTTPSSVPNSN